MDNFQTHVDSCYQQFELSFRRHPFTAKDPLVSRSQTFRPTAEGLEYMAAFIGQGPPMRSFYLHVKQPITVNFVQRHNKTVCETLECLLKIIWRKL